jgi:hypothetical protein
MAASERKAVIGQTLISLEWMTAPGQKPSFTSIAKESPVIDGSCLFRRYFAITLTLFNFDVVTWSPGFIKPLLLWTV